MDEMLNKIKLTEEKLSKLYEERDTRIRGLIQAGISAKEVAIRFEITRQRVYQIWNHS